MESLNELQVDWRAELQLEAQLLAVWDFDYHQVSLRLEGARIVLRKHAAAGHFNA